MSRDHTKVLINHAILALLDIRRNLSNPLTQAPTLIEIEIDPDEEDVEMRIILESNEHIDVDFQNLDIDPEYSKQLLTVDLRSVVQEEGLDKAKTH